MKNLSNYILESYNAEKWSGYNPAFNLFNEDPIDSFNYNDIITYLKKFLNNNIYYEQTFIIKDRNLSGFCDITDKQSKEWLDTKNDDHKRKFSLEDILSIKLSEKIFFGKITQTGKLTKNVYGYLKIDKSNNEVLILNYTENKDDAILFDTVKDLLDEIKKYKEVKIELPKGYAASKQNYANSVELYADFSIMNKKFKPKHDTCELGIFIYK